MFRDGWRFGVRQRLGRCCALVAAFALPATGCEPISRLLAPDEPSAIESYVDEPHTLVALRARAEELGARFTQQERNDRAQGSACHGGACLIIAPFLLVHVLFPDRWIEATVEAGDGVHYRGRFRTQGDLLTMTVQRAGLEREIALLELPALGRRVVVEVARRASAEQTWQPTAIVAQVDLRAAYGEAASGAADARRERDVLVEALRVLDADALAIVAASLTEPTPRRAGLLYTLVMTACADTATSDPVIRALVAHAARGGGHETAHEALRCAAARKLALDARELRSLSAQVIGGYCAARGSDEWKRHDWLLLARALGAAATPSTAVLAACESPVRRSAVRQVFGLPLEANDLAQLFASPERDAFDVADRLPCERAEVAALAEQACLKTATAAAARCLARAKRVVAPAVLAALAHGYLRALDDFDEHWAAEVLRVFHAAAHDRARTEPARAVLLAARKGADESSDLALRAGMTCLGDAQHAAALAQAREHPERHDRVHAKLLASDALAACTP